MAVVTTYRLDNITYTGHLKALHCSDCGVPFGLDQNYMAERRDDHRGFYCPNGHSQWYPQKTATEKERERREAAEAELQVARRQRESARVEAERQKRRASAAKGQRTRILNLIRAGMCPYCTNQNGQRRHFANVERHISCQHADESTA